MSGGFFRGTSTAQDPRFADKQAKLLKSVKFAPGVQEPVDMTKVNKAAMEPWIARRVTELLGLEDEVLINFIYGLLEGKKVDGRQVQIQLTGFMEKHTLVFMKELWALLLSAQQNVSGIPQQFLDEKIEEAKRKKMEEAQLLATIEQKRRDEENMNLEVEMARQRAQEAAARLSAAIFGGTPQTPGDAGSAPPLAAATAAPGSTLAADVVEGERVAAPGGAPQEQGAIVPDSTAGTVHKLQEKKDEGRAHTRVLRAAEAAQEQGGEGEARSPRGGRRRSPARRPRLRSRSRSRSPSSSRSPPPRGRSPGNSWRSRRSSPARRNYSPSLHGRVKGEWQYGRSGGRERGRGRDQYEGRDRDYYDARDRDRDRDREKERDRARDRDRDMDRDRDRGRGRGSGRDWDRDKDRDRDYYEGSRSRARDGHRDGDRGYHQRVSPDGASDDGEGQPLAGGRPRPQGPSPDSRLPAAPAGRGRWERPGHNRGGGRSASPSPPRSARDPGGERKRAPPLHQRGGDEASAGEEEGTERPLRRHCEAGPQEPGTGALDVGEAGRRGALRPEEADTTHPSPRSASRRSVPDADARGHTEGSIRGHDAGKSGRGSMYGKRRWGSELGEEGGGEEERREEEDEEGEEEAEGDVPAGGERGQRNGGQSSKEHGQRDQEGEPGASLEEDEASRREAKRVRREEKRQRKEERRRKREERRKRQEERHAGAEAHRLSARSGDQNSGSAEDELLAGAQGSDQGTGKPHGERAPDPPSKAVEEELRKRAMLSLKAKRAQAQGSD